MPVLKNPKHELFCSLIAKGETVTASLAGSGTALKPCDKLSGYYVYLLVDTRTDTVFYVGKGKKRRAFAHVAGWRTGVVVNLDKHDRIGAIIEGGGEVGHFCVADGLKEHEAFALERQFILGIGKDRLTNFSSGARGDMEYAAFLRAIIRDGAWAEKRLKTIRPYCRWKRRIDHQLNPKDIPGGNAEVWYWNVIGEFSKMAKAGREVRASTKA